ncbi:class I SAM-dependent methyltransferase [Fuscibacter oryzae]|uniref:Class I SAM-dependent methyltransferase n=1 Tax=Fuscibacter oryzae TaxID=2803939 RepID=A0A8J7SVR9_9RHOB|nr:class I SAM-dependent methyltransferase [Fuscibacter oryzae]MBL4929807.1 class I SAM-dependent methyltransferase [Fuscibacter oryzae]
MTHPISPYLVPGFYDRELARGRHRDIVGGRWDETGEAQIRVLLEAGLRPHHRLLDIGCGALRLGCKVVPYLDPGHYWGTDQSAALMQRGYELELADKNRLPPGQLVEDAGFTYPAIPDTIDFAIAWGVFTHLPAPLLAGALPRLRARFPCLKAALVTVFLAPEGAGATRQRDGVVTHPDRPPYHITPKAMQDMATAAGFAAEARDDRLPRGQVLWTLR